MRSMYPCSGYQLRAVGDLVQTRDVYSDASQEEWGEGRAGERKVLKGFLHSNVCGFFFFSLLLSSKKTKISFQSKTCV